MDASSHRKMLAYSREMTHPWIERQNMSKTAAVAAVSTECGFANSAAELARRRVDNSDGRKERFHAL